MKSRIIFTMLAILAVSTSYGESQNYDRVISKNFYNRSPLVLPGTTLEMHDTSYWIAKMKNPDEVVMTVQAIQKKNSDYKKLISSSDPFAGIEKERIPNLDHWWPGYTIVAPDMFKMSPEAAADTVRARMNIFIQYLRSREFGNGQAVIYSPPEIDNFEKEMALSKVGKTVKPLRAIAAKNTRVRSVPSFNPEQVGLWENGMNRWDIFNVCILKIGNPATVLHVSESGEYLFVLTSDAYGWVRSEDMAFGDEKTVKTFSDPANFAVCTGDRIQFYSDQSCRYSSGWFDMGNRLPLISKTDKRKILIPMRQADGTLTTGTAWLPENADISVGFLPYTRRNVVTTAFKQLENTYDWTGGWFGRNHETTYRDIFAVFGFELPFHGALFTIYSVDTRKILRPEMEKAEMNRIMLSNEPFLTLQSCGGHAQLLLGDNGAGEPIVFDQHGYGYKDEDGTQLEVRRCCIGDMRMPSYFLKRIVTFAELK